MTVTGPSAVEHAARIVLRPIGNPLPLGFLALAGGTLLVSGLQLGWLQPEDGAQVGLIVVAFVFPLQLVAAIFGFLARDVVAATGMGILAGSWLSIGLIQLTSSPGATSDPLGLFLLLAAVAMAVPTAAAATGKLVAVAVLGTTVLRFATTGLYQLTASGTWEDIAGVVGVVLAAVAVYAAAAMAIEDAKRQTVLPLGRRGPGAESLAGNFDDQLERLEREAGVREQL
jgi:succinate-acetate transporter protein